MRQDFVDSVRAAESGELLTTGEAAKLLGVSRQHVVDMCDRGDLPYMTVGTHRRIRRSDVLSAQSRTQRMSRDQRRALWLNHAVAGELVRDPELALSVARRNLEKLRASHRSKRWTDEWEKLIGGPIEDVLFALTSPSPKNRELRQNSPFAGLLSEEDRERVLASFGRPDPARSHAQE